MGAPPLTSGERGKVNAQGQGLINVGARSQGMLEELEKAHIYIEQLHDEMNGMKSDNTNKGEQIAALTQEVIGNQAQLETLQGQATVRKTEMTVLKDEMATLKALMHQ